MPASNQHYRGRFAPSPTGPLHLGSLIAALASYLDARHHGGSWLVRMEDLDPPREEPGAADGILKSLSQHGLRWDDEVLYQSARTAAYDAALRELDEGGHLFACNCSRSMLGAEGTCIRQCRTRQQEITGARALRINIPDNCEVDFTDGLQGRQHLAAGQFVTDFVVRRKDGLDAYQLAVVVDDAQQGITHVVRGSDLLDSTPRQIYLQQRLSLPTPDYFHLPVITTVAGQKFSKQNLAPALQDSSATRNLRDALRFLHQPEPAGSLIDVDSILQHAVVHWSRERIPAAMDIRADSLGL